jgi:hypothetical protein
MLHLKTGESTTLSVTAMPWRDGSAMQVTLVF